VGEKRDVPMSAVTSAVQSATTAFDQIVAHIDAKYGADYSKRNPGLVMSLLKYAGLKSAPAEKSDTKPDTTVEDDIIDLLTHGPQPSGNAIASLLPRRRSDVLSTMADLKIKGRIVRSAEGWRINEGGAA
jgi:hypothetical protein